MDRYDRHADPVDRSDDPRRRRRGPGRRGRRDLRARAAGHGGLLEPARRDRTCVHPRRVAQDRRHGRHGRARLLQDHRPQEGHDRRLRIQGLSEPDRGCRGVASGRRRGRRDRRAGRAIGRGGQDRRRAQGPGADRRGPARALPAIAHRLQDPEDHRVPPRAAAEVEPRQDPSSPVARRTGRTQGGGGSAAAANAAVPAA